MATSTAAPTDAAAAAAANLSYQPHQLGPLIRLWGLNMSQIPKPDDTPDQLAPFLISLLQEAVPFIDSVSPKASGTSARLSRDVFPSNELWRPRGVKSNRDSKARISLLQRIVPASELARLQQQQQQQQQSQSQPQSEEDQQQQQTRSSKKEKVARVRDETWVCRASEHTDAAEAGTASWAEFRSSFKDAHPATELESTPGVTGARVARRWDCGAVEAVEGGDTWGRFTLELVEMRHNVGKPLGDRVFPVLQMTCAAMEEEVTVDPAEGTAEAGEQGIGGVAGATTDAAAVRRHERPEFLVVSVTINDFATASPDAELSKEHGVVVGAYASVERIRKTTEDASGRIEWLMATASDARGALPQWVQNLAVPGAIAKDVWLFFSWIAKQRKSAAVAGKNPAAVEGGTTTAATNGGGNTTRSGAD